MATTDVRRAELGEPKGATMTTTADELRELGRRWAGAEVAGGTETLGRLVTDDFRLVGPYGFALDREQWLDRDRSGDLVTTSWIGTTSRSDHGAAAMSIGTQTQEAAYRGAANNGDFGSVTSSCAAMVAGRSPGSSSA
jgi:hypothetical protein